MTALIAERGLVAFVPEHGACRRVAHFGGPRQDLLHSVVWRKRFPFLDTDRREQSTQLRLNHFDRFSIDDGMEFFIEVEVCRVNGVHRLLRSVVELHLGRIGCPGEWIDLQAFAEQLAREIRLSVLEEASRDEPIHPGG